MTKTALKPVYRTKIPIDYAHTPFKSGLSYPEIQNNPQSRLRGTMRKAGEARHLSRGADINPKPRDE